MLRGAASEARVESSNSRASSSGNESRLPDRLGTSLEEYRPSGLLDAIEVAGVVAFASEIGSQQKVSLFHNLQLRFSNRRPCSNDAAHLENTTRGLVLEDAASSNCAVGLTCPHAEEILDIASVDLVYETHVYR